MDTPTDLLAYVDVGPRSRRYRHWTADDRVDLESAAREYFRVPVRDGPGGRPTVDASVFHALKRHVEARWEQVLAARVQAEASTDPIVRWELGAMQRGEHRNQRMRLHYPDMPKRVSPYGRVRAVAPLPEPILAVAQDLMAHPEIGSVTFLAHGDWQFIRVACIEQLRRCGEIPKSCRKAFPICIKTPWSGYSNDIYAGPEDFVPLLSPYPDWTRGVKFQDEGFLHSDLLVDDGVFHPGWSHGGIDRSLGIRGDGRGADYRSIKVVLASYPDPEAETFRRWLRHDSSWVLGMHPDCGDGLLSLAQRHGFTTGPTSGDAP